METLMNYPLAVFVCALVGLWAAEWVGVFVRRRVQPGDSDRGDIDFVIGAILTLLGLLIGFTFSMAVSRYDQRKNYEEEEANAIGTEYVRAELLPGEDAAAVRQLLSQYVQQRMKFYTTRDARTLDQINAETSRLQSEMWSRVKTAASAQPNPIMAVVVTGMNDVLNTQGYTQAAWWNRIPISAWGLMALISLGCNALVGYSARHPRTPLFMVLPVAVSISFLLIADIDSPRGGLIRVAPQNLVSLSESIRPQ